MKTLALALVFLSVLTGGVRLLRERRIQNRQLGELAEYLELFRGELSAKGAPLPELLRCLRDRCGGLSGDLLDSVERRMDQLGEKSFCEIWTESVKDCCASIPAELRSELAGLGQYLGRYSLEEQLSVLDRCSRLFRSRYLQGIQEEPIQSRLILGLSAAAGALLTILLI